MTIIAPGSTDTRFENWRVLGRGGTATVFRVYDAKLRYDIAIKILHQKMLSDPNKRAVLVRGLRDEVFISRQLRHRNICAVHDLYEGPEGVGVVMDVVEGMELRDWMDRNANALLATAADRLVLLKRLTSALEEAHTLIVHRDLKPQNILLRGGDVREPVIMDFGFAIVGEQASADSTVAMTYRYAAPEQYEAPATVTRHADLWALGMMAYELFTGDVPPNSLKDVGRTRKVPRVPIEQIAPPSLRNAAVPPALDRVILQLMAYEPHRRIPTAGDVLDALRGVELRAADGPGAGPGATDRRANAVRVEGGDYVLGARAGGDTRPNELPGRRVRITPFLIDRHPVTNAEYEAFALATGHARPPLSDQRVANYAQLPVVGVTHAEAMAFARWVGGTLPTEAQWECAARGGVPHADYPWGADRPGPTTANIDNVAAGPTPVGSFPAGDNPLGIADLCGNVWEWCVDAYEDTFYRTLAKDAINPVNARPSGPRVLRGGSFQSLPVMGRCAFRSAAPPDERRNDIGFRVAYPPARDEEDPAA